MGALTKIRKVLAFILFFEAVIYLGCKIFQKKIGIVNFSQKSVKNFFINEAVTLLPISKFDMKKAKSDLSVRFHTRHQRLKNVCDEELPKNEELQKTNSLLGEERWNLYYDYDDRLLVCTIGKAASTNWYFHFLKLGVLRSPDKIDPDKISRAHLRHAHYGQRWQEHSNAFHAATSMITAAFYRHPFKRLVSLYNDKIAKPETKFFPAIRKEIIEKYRQKRNETNDVSNKQPSSKEENNNSKNETDFPTPFEFVQYFFDVIPEMTNISNVNRHFAAQHLKCPFCSIKFDVLGRIETYESDMSILLETVGLEKVLNVSLNLNTGNSDDDSVQTFFSQLPKNSIEKLYQYYRLDFLMFGYDYPSSFINMGYEEMEHQEVDTKNELEQKRVFKEFY